MRLLALFLSLLPCLGGALWAQVPDQKIASQAVPLTVKEPPATGELRFATQRVSFKTPIGWQSVHTKGGQDGMLASFVAPNAFGATLSVAHSADAGRTKLPDNLPATIGAALVKKYPGFKQLAKQRVTVQGADAWRLDGQLRPAGQDVVIRNRQVYVCRDGNIYIFTLTCKQEDFERLTLSLDRLLKSVSWLD